MNDYLNDKLEAKILELDHFIRGFGLDDEKRRTECLKEFAEISKMITDAQKYDITVTKNNIRGIHTVAQLFKEKLLKDCSSIINFF